jgi:DNA-binding GntR family transcriptional regulator
MDRKVFDSICDTVSIKVHVYNQLKNAILTHKLRPKERITEAAVAQQMNVSHTPVREALRDLAKEGLINIIPNKGSYVASLEAKDIEEIYTLRLVLEQLSIKLSQEKLNEQKIKEIEDIALKCKESARTNILRKYNEYDSLYHLMLVQLSGNRRLVDFYITLKGQIQLIMVASIGDPYHLNPNQKTPDHFQIIAHLRKGNIEGACDIIEKHVLGSMTDALENISRSAV